MDEEVRAVFSPERESEEMDDTICDTAKLDESSVSSARSNSRIFVSSRHLYLQFFCFCFSILLSVSSYSGLMDLQSSINIADALGNKSLTLMSVSTVACSLFVTPILVRAFGAKTAIIMSQCCYVVYVLANFYPVSYILLPGGIFFGIAEGLLCTPVLMYCTYYGRRLARFESSDTKDQINKFVGYFWAVYQMNEIFGNMISTVVLNTGKSLSLIAPESGSIVSVSPDTVHIPSSNLSSPNQGTSVSSLNATENATTVFDFPELGKYNSTVANYLPNSFTGRTNATIEETLRDFSMCGANDCYDQTEYESVMENYVPMSTTAFYVMIGVYTSLAVAAIPIMVTIPGIPRKRGKNDGEKTNNGMARGRQMTSYFRIMKKNLKKVAKQFIDPQQLLLTPITLYHGLYTAFISSEITRGYVSCTVGVEKVGLAMLAGGVANVIVSFCFGHLAGHNICRNIFLGAAISMDFLLYFFCLFWTPTEDTTFYAYVICILFGATDGVWSPFIDGKYAKYFAHNEEVAYSIHNVWSWTGFALTYGWTMALCIREKIYIQICVLVISVIGCAGAEYMQRRKQTQCSSDSKL